MKNTLGDILYAAAMLFCGAAQLIDWYFGSEDPIWHLFFYMLIMPVASFIYGVLPVYKVRRWTRPLFAAFMASLVYLLMANGGPSFSILELKSAFTLCVPSAAASLVGCVIGRFASGK